MKKIEEFSISQMLKEIKREVIVGIMKMKINLRKQGNNYENQPMEKRFCEKYEKK